MKVYRIKYQSIDGTVLDTVLGEPMASFDLAAVDSFELVEAFFYLVHPGCKILSCDLCSF